MNTTRDVCIGTALLGSFLIGLHADPEPTLWGFTKLGLGGVLWTMICMVVFRFLGSQKI